MVSTKINCKYLHTLLYQVSVKSIALHVHLEPQLKDKLPETSSVHKRSTTQHKYCKILSLFINWPWLISPKYFCPASRKTSATLRPHWTWWQYLFGWQDWQLDLKYINYIPTSPSLVSVQNWPLWHSSLIPQPEMLHFSENTSQYLHKCKWNGH